MIAFILLFLLAGLYVHKTFELKGDRLYFRYEKPFWLILVCIGLVHILSLFVKTFLKIPTNVVFEIIENISAVSFFASLFGKKIISALLSDTACGNCLICYLRERRATYFTLIVFFILHVLFEIPELLINDLWYVSYLALGVGFLIPFLVVRRYYKKLILTEVQKLEEELPMVIVKIKKTDTS